MLHYTIFYLSWIGSAMQPCDLAEFSPIDTASAVHQELLVACLKTRMVVVKTVSRRDHRVTELGALHRFEAFRFRGRRLLYLVPSCLQE